jgi:ketol-acid reductoisomerase
MKKQIVSIIGYGSQGRAIALNLRDSGYHVIIGLRPKSKFHAIARKDGFRQILSIADATQKGDVITFAFPDHQHGRVYKTEIEPVLRSKKAMSLLFLHGM